MTLAHVAESAIVVFARLTGVTESAIVVFARLTGVAESAIVVFARLTGVFFIWKSRARHADIEFEKISS